LISLKKCILHIMIETITTTLALLTLLAHVALMLALALWIVNKKKKLDFLKPVLELINKHGLIILLIIPLAAIVGSLFYEIYANFEPCLLCWWQRIFIYPQALLVLTAIFYETRDVIKYLIPLSILGSLTSLLHYTEQMQARISPNSDPFITCSFGDVSCSSSYIFEFGYITIPLMTLTAFVFIIIVSLMITHQKRRFWETTSTMM